MKDIFYIVNEDGARIWLKRGNDKFKQECEEYRKRILKQVKDEDLDEVD